MPGFGRLPSEKDSRDANYHMPRMMQQLFAVPRTTPYADGPLLNQEQTQRCVAFSGKGFLTGEPMMSLQVWPPTEQTIYEWCQARDPWAGQGHDGTTVRALCQAFVDNGLISNYAWGQTSNESIEWLQNGHGTQWLGVDWFPSMMDVDAKGFLEKPQPFANPVGGHCVRVVWYDAKLDCFVIRNSWGFWGMPDKFGFPSGYARIDREFFDWLMARDGELAGPTQRRLLPVIA